MKIIATIVVFLFIVHFSEKLREKISESIREKLMKWYRFDYGTGTSREDEANKDSNEISQSAVNYVLAALAIGFLLGLWY